MRKGTHSNRIKKKRSGTSLLEKFDRELFAEISNLDRLERVDLIIGILIHGETENLSVLVQALAKNIKNIGLGEKAAILISGPREKVASLKKKLERIGHSEDVLIHVILLGRKFASHGWSACALMRVSDKFKAPIILFPSMILPPERDDSSLDNALATDWIFGLVNPIAEHDYDLVISSYDRHPLLDPVDSLFSYPLLSGIFGFRIMQPAPGLIALSHRFAQACISEADLWSQDMGIYALNPWFLARALAKEFKICRVFQRISTPASSFPDLKPAFHQVAHTLFHQTVINANWWLNRSEIVFTPPSIGYQIEAVKCDVQYSKEELTRILDHEFGRFKDTLFKEVIPEKMLGKMESMVRGSSPIALTSREWVEVLQGFTLIYGFEDRFHPNDIIDGLFPFFLARLLGFIDEMEKFESLLGGTGGIGAVASRLIFHEADRILNEQADLFIESWSGFRDSWRDREMETSSYLPRLGAWEFVPNVGVIVPQVVENDDGTPASASEVYQELIEKYRKEFTAFLAQRLGMREIRNSTEVMLQIRNFMHDLDSAIHGVLFSNLPPDPSEAKKTIDLVLKLFAKDFNSVPVSLQLTEYAAVSILEKNPPRNLITRLGCRNISGLLKQLNPLDALAMAAGTEFNQYLERVLDYTDKNGQVDWFNEAPVVPLILDLPDVGDETDLRGTTALSLLAGRTLTSGLQARWGNEFSSAWMLLRLAKSVVAMEEFSRIWSAPGKKGDEIRQITKCIRGYWGRHILSAHHAFENYQHRIIAARLRRYAKYLPGNKPENKNASQFLESASDVYHLSITLPDTTFIPLSAWTWASFSHQGGLGSPAPLSSSVERDWATCAFLALYMKKAGLGDYSNLSKKVLELVKDGRASENLRDHLFGVSADPDRLFIIQRTAETPIPSGKFIRMSEGPILESIPDHAWESKYVLNPAAIRFGSTIYILYRAFGDDGVSRIGLAWTRDGVNIEGRLDKPIFEASDPSEAAGCEDPRVTVIGDKIYMLYTAWDKEIPQIAMASIPVDAFLEKKFDKWERDGLGFPGLSNKDAVLYPEKFGDQYVIYHRIDPNLWVSYLERLSCPWPRSGQKIVASPRPGMMWDSVKIGAGAPPIKTRYGWLNIYHGVNYEKTYRLGVMFMALDDPTRILYQSPNFILEPERDYEIGESKSRDYWVPHVVFTCGAVAAEDKPILDLDDEIYVYYGAADTAIAAARGRIRDLVPIIGSES